MLDKFLLNNKAKLEDAIEQIHVNSKGFILVENDVKQILGTLTDGDIRRALLAGAKLSDLAFKDLNKLNQYLYG
tara:strand:- start:165 stop:386 length:222 start_codon:yes stop_codon:yes gene_type:complete